MAMWEKYHIKKVYCPIFLGHGHLIGLVTGSSKGYATVISGQFLQDSGEHGKTSGFHDHGPTAALFWVQSECLDQKQCSMEYDNVR